MNAPASAVDFGNLRLESLDSRFMNMTFSSVARPSRTTPRMTSAKPKFLGLLTGKVKDEGSDSFMY